MVRLAPFIALRARDAGLVRDVVVRQDEAEVGRREGSPFCRDPLVGRSRPGVRGEREEEERGEKAFHRRQW